MYKFSDTNDAMKWDFDKLCDPDDRTAVIVSDDDWEGLYIGGTLRYEHHHVELDSLNSECDRLGMTSIPIPIYESCVDGVAFRLGAMPTELRDVQRFIEHGEIVTGEV